MASEIVKRETRPAVAEGTVPARIRRILDRWAVDVAVKGSAPRDDEETAKRIQGDLWGFILDLEGPSPSLFETTLAETAGLCWLALRVAQVNAETSGLSLSQAAWRQKKLDHCQRRYLSVLKTLATVRKLASPVPRVNVAGRQVNVASGS